MGSTDDPENGAAVAATVFSAVIVYAVRSTSLRQLRRKHWKDDKQINWESNRRAHVW